MEVDALAEWEEVRWVVEIKWRNQQTGLKEMQKAQALGGRPWYISQTGFTSHAIAFAQNHQILYSSRAQMEPQSRKTRSSES